MFVCVLFLAAAVCVLRPASAQAGTSGDFTFELDGDTHEITITAYNGNSANVVIPAKIGSYPVTKIAYYAFNAEKHEGCKNIVTVTFESGSKVKIIDWGAFCGCTSLKTIKLPSTLEQLPGGVFYGCTSLDHVTIPKGVTSIGSTSIGGTFEGCTSLTDITLPSTLTHIDYAVFRGCTSLASITIPSGVNSFSTCIFAGSGLTSIKIPEGTETMGWGIFQDCKNLKKVVLPSTLTKIESSAFSGCSSLTSVNIPAHLTGLEGSAFKGCTALKTLTFGNDVQYPADSAFNECTNLVVRVVAGSTIEEVCLNNDVDYVIYAYSIEGATVTNINTKTYTGSALGQSPVVTLNGDKLVKGTDYTLSYSNNVNAGSLTATVTITGKGKYVGTIEKKFSINQVNMSKCSVKLSGTKYTCNNKAKKPTVTLTYKGKKLSSDNYYVTYSSNYSCGTATVTIYGRKNFTNSKTTKFTIVPAATTIKKITGKSKSFYIKFKRNTVGTTGYYVQCARNKSMTSGVKTFKFTSNYTNAMTIKKGLKSKTTYYVRVRCYSYNWSQKKNYYSAWSKIKKVKTK